MYTTVVYLSIFLLLGYMPELKWTLGPLQRQKAEGREARAGSANSTSENLGPGVEA